MSALEWKRGYLFSSLQGISFPSSYEVRSKRCNGVFEPNTHRIRTFANANSILPPRLLHVIVVLLFPCAHLSYNNQDVVVKYVEMK